MNTIRRSETPHKLADLAYRSLKRSIVIGDLPQGTPLIPNTLVELLGIGRTPTREALQRLEADGLVESTPGATMKVRRITRAAAVDLVDTFMHNIGRAHRLGLPRLSRSDIATMDDLQRELEALSQPEFEVAFPRMSKIAAVVYQASGSDELIRIIGFMFPRVQLVTRLSDTNDEFGTYMLKNTRLRIDAIRAGDLSRAQDLFEESNSVGRELVNGYREIPSDLD